MSDDVIGRGVVELEVRDNGVEAGIAKVDQALAGLGPSATKAGAEASAGVAKIGDGAATAADKVDAATTRAAKSIHNLGEAGRKAADGAGGLPKLGAGASEADKKIDAATRNMIASIQRTTAAMEAGSRTGSEYFRVLASQRGVDPAALKPYLAQLDAATAKQTRAGITAGEMSNAMRTLPAQFTDIATSLAGGQDPLLVFIQQGGQLKDMFGGVGPAAQAMGQYIAGLVNPLTVSVAAVAALTYAYHVGSQEAQDYANALIATNNAAGTTAGQMADMAASIDAYYGTQRAAAEAIAALAETGKVSGDNMERFAAVSEQWADATGQSVGDVVEYFAALGKDPVEASLKLDESLRFLTASVLDQITALVEQGRETEAVSVAQNALADVLAKRAPEMQQNIGLIETSWKGVKNVVTEVLDAMASIGRQQTSAQRLAEIKTSLKSGLSTTTSGRDERQRPLSDAELKALRLEQDGLESDMRRAKTDAARDADREAARQESVRLARDNQAWMKANQTRAQRRDKELADQRKFLEAGEITQKEFAARSEAIRKKYEEKPRRGRTGSGLSSSDNAMASIAGDIAARKRELEMLTAENTVTAKLTATQEKILVVEEKIGLAKKESTKASLRQQLAGLKELDQLEQQIAAREKVNKAADEERKLNERHLKSINDDVAATEEQVRNYGLNAAQIAENTALTSELTLAEAIKNGSSAETIDTLRQQADAYRRLADAQAGLQDKKDVEGREKLAADEAKKAADEWQKSADQINQSLTDALMQGFEDGKGFAENFADSLKATFKTMVLRPMVQAVVQPVGEVANGLIYGQPGAAGQQGMFAGTPFGANSASGLGQLISGYGNFTGSAGTAAYGAGMGLTPEQAAAAAEQYANAGMTDIANSITAGQSAASSAGSMASYAALIYGSIDFAKGVGKAFESGDYADIWKSTQSAQLINQLFGGKGGEKSGGNYNAAYDASGKAVAENLFGGYTPSNADGEVKKAVTGFYKTYADTVRKLGGEVQDLTVNLGFDTDPHGTAGNRLTAQLAVGQIGVGADEGQAEHALWQASLISMVDSSVGEIPQAIEETTGKMLLAALQASELPEEYARIFDGVDIEAASADQVAAMTAALESTKLLSDVFAQFGTVFPQLAGVAYDAREAIVAAGGGLDVFASGLSAYRDNFYSVAERSAADMEQLQAQFAKLNLTMPATRDGFRQLVEAQDLATLSGQAAYAALIGLSGAFAEITAASEAARSAALTDARQDVADAYRRESDALQSSIDRLDRFVRGLRDFRNGLALSDLSTLSPEQKYAEARQQFESTLAAAQGGDEAAQEQMQEVSSAFLEASRAYNASSGQYAADYARVTSATLLLESSAKAQLSLQRRQLDLLQKQVDGLLEINESVLSVVDAIKALEGAMAAAVTTPAPGGVGGGGVGNASGPVYTGAGAAPAGSVSPQHAVNDLYKQILGREADVGGLLAYSSWVMQGKSLQEVAASLRNSDEYKSINGSHADGLGFVPFDGYRAELHRGEAVLTAQQNRVFQSIDWSRFGNADNAALLSEVKALRAEVSALRADTAADADAGRRQAEAIARATLQQGGELATSLERTAADRI